MRRLIQILFGKKIFDLQPDGLIESAPVWVEFMVKILTSIGITYGVFVLFPVTLPVAALCGSIVFYGLLLAYKIWKGGFSSETKLSQVICDAFCDYMLASVAFIGAMWQLNWMLGLALLIPAYIVYRLTVTQASPGDR